MAFKRVKDPFKHDGEGSNDRMNRLIEQRKQAKNKRLVPFRNQKGNRVSRGKSFFYYNGGEPRKVDGEYANNSKAQLSLDNMGKRSRAFRTKVPNLAA